MKNNLFSKLEKVFWIIYILIPLTTGILAYRHLPNESPDENKHEILASYEECDPMYNQCGEVPIAWKDKITGQIYTKSDFSEHSKKEGLIAFLKRIGYGVLGLSFYFLFIFFKKDKKQIINYNLEHDAIEIDGLIKNRQEEGYSVLEIAMELQKKYNISLKEVNDKLVEYNQQNKKITKKVEYSTKQKNIQPESILSLKIPSEEVPTDLKKDYILECIKTLNPNEFPRITSLTNSEILLMIEIIFRSTEEDCIEDALTIREHLLIYENILDKESNNKKI